MSLTFSDLPEEGAAEAQKKIRRQQSAGYWNYLLERCRTILLPYAVFFLVYYAAYWAGRTAAAVLECADSRFRDGRSVGAFLLHYDSSSSFTC